MPVESQPDPTDESPEDVVAMADEVEHDESVNTFRAWTNRLLAKQKGLLAAIAIVATLLILVVLWPGGADSTGEDTAVKSTAVIQITTLDDSESWFGKSELYLKVESSLYPDLAVLCPINVGDNSGQRQKILRLPFFHQGETDEILMFEILDEDKLNSEQEEKILSIVESGTFLLWQGNNLYAMTQGVDMPSAAQANVVNITTLTSSLIFDTLGQHVFDSYARGEYKVSPNPPLNLRDANILTIKDDDNEAIAEIRVYYPKAAEK